MAPADLKAPPTDDRILQHDPQPSVEVTYTTVYTFVIYDHDKGTTVIHPRMANRQTIANMRGKVNEDTAWVINTNELDAMGFYNPEKKPAES